MSKVWMSKPKLNLNSTRTNSISAISQLLLAWFWPNFNPITGTWDHLEQIPAVTMTFVKATFDLGTFVHIRNISPVTDPILIKLLDKFFVGLNFSWSTLVWTQTFSILYPNFFLIQFFRFNFLDPNLIGFKTNVDSKFVDPSFFSDSTFF